MSLPRPSVNRLTVVALAVVVSCIGSGLRSADAQAQKQIFGHQGTIPGQRFAMGVTGVGDVDIDGHDDYAIEEMNAVTVFSGRTGTPIRKFAMSGVDFVYPALAGGGDVNKDGVPDLIVGDWNSSAQQRGMVWVVSGLWIAQGTPPQMIHTLDADLLGWRDFGSIVDDGGDLDGDGWDDILVGATDNAQTAFFGVAFSGRTGKELWRQANMSDVRPAGDVDKDGKDDVIGYSNTVATVYSGLNGRALRTVNGSSRSGRSTVSAT